MSSELMKLSDGIFTLTETEDPNIFYFYRNDNEVIGDVGEMPMDFYQNYIVRKMFNGEIPGMVVNTKFRFEESNDGKYIRITTFDSLDAEVEETPNFIKGFFNKIFKGLFR